MRLSGCCDNLFVARDVLPRDGLSFVAAHNPESEVIINRGSHG
jgi:hypothetical protein